MGRDSELIALLYPKPQKAVCAHRTGLGEGPAPQRGTVPPPPTPNPHHPLPYSHAHPHALAPATPPAPSVQQPTTMVAVDTGDDAARPAQAEGAGLALLPGSCFIHPLRAARIVSVSGPRLFPGCFARHSFRSCAARLKPAFALQPPSCAALLPPATAVQIQAEPVPVALQPPFNRKAAPSLPGPRRLAPRHGGSRKKTRSTIQYKSNGAPAPHAERVGEGAVVSALC